MNKAGYRAQAVAQSKDQAAKKRKAAETKTGMKTSSRKGTLEAATTGESLKMEVRPYDERLESTHVNTVCDCRPILPLTH